MIAVITQNSISKFDKCVCGKEVLYRLEWVLNVRKARTSTGLCNVWVGCFYKHAFNSINWLFWWPDIPHQDAFNSIVNWLYVFENSQPKHCMTYHTSWHPRFSKIGFDCWIAYSVYYKTSLMCGHQNITLELLYKVWRFSFNVNSSLNQKSLRNCFRIFHIYWSCFCV